MEVGVGGYVQLAGYTRLGLAAPIGVGIHVRGPMTEIAAHGLLAPSARFGGPDCRCDEDVVEPVAARVVLGGVGLESVFFSDRETPRDWGLQLSTSVLWGRPTVYLPQRGDDGADREMSVLAGVGPRVTWRTDRGASYVGLLGQVGGATSPWRGAGVIVGLAVSVGFAFFP